MVIFHNKKLIQYNWEVNTV